MWHVCKTRVLACTVYYGEPLTDIVQLLEQIYCPVRYFWSASLLNLSIEHKWMILLFSSGTGTLYSVCGL